MIPQVFERPGAQFVLIGIGKKFPPIQTGWQLPENGHGYAEACEHVKKGGNAGLLAGQGYGGLDQDQPEAFQGLELPITTTWETRPRRLGFWLRWTDSPEEILPAFGFRPEQAYLFLFKEGVHVGEIKLQRSYQVIPPSWKEIDGQKVEYRLLKEVPPVEVSLQWLLEELQKLGIAFSGKEKPADILDRMDKAAKSEESKRPYALKVLKGEVQKVAGALVGSRNDQLNIAAFRVGQVAHMGLIDDEIIQALAAVAEDDEPEKILPTIKSGLEAGKQNPREIPEAYQPSTEPTGQEGDSSEPVDPEIKEKAMRIAERGDPLKFMLNTFNKSHIGDRNHAETQLVAFGMQSSLNTKGVSESWGGPSGKGKTDAAKACIRQLPPEYVLEGSITAKSLYYHAGDLLPAGVLFLDDKNIEANSDLEKTLKDIQTNFQEGAYHETIDGQKKLQRTRLPPRFLVVRTYVDSVDADVQLQNRAVDFTVDSSPETDKAVCDLILELAEEGQTTDRITDHILICRELWRDIKAQAYRVKMPLLRKLVKISDAKNRRNPSLFADLIVGLACIRHRQRVKEPGDNGETVLYATLEDYQDAARIFNGQRDFLGSRLSPAEQFAITAIKTSESGMSTKDVFKALAAKFPNEGWNEQKARRLIFGRHDRDGSGLVGKIPGLEVDNDPNWNGRGQPTKLLKLDSFTDLDLFGLSVKVYTPEEKSLSVANYPKLSQIIPRVGQFKTNNNNQLSNLTIPIIPYKENKEGDEATALAGEKVSSPCSPGKSGITGIVKPHNEPEDNDKSNYPISGGPGIDGIVKPHIGPTDFEKSVFHPGTISADSDLDLKEIPPPPGRQGEALGGLQVFKAVMRKRECSLCGRVFNYDLTSWWHDGQHDWACYNCLHSLTPAHPEPPSPQQTLIEESDTETGYTLAAEDQPIAGEVIS